jgi:uncharacterized protein
MAGASLGAQASEDPGVDANGFIRRAPRDPVGPEFLDLLKDVCATLDARVGPFLHSLYVYGSVATGQAKPFVSDLDLSMVLQRPATTPELATIESARIALEKRHPEVVKVDFDIGVLADVISPARELDWGYWLKHHCRCVLGEDLSERFEPFKPSRAIAQAVNGDFEVVLGKYAERIATLDVGAQSASLRREAARKLIRSTNVLRSSEDQTWPVSLQAHYAAFRRRFPSMGEELDFFMREATDPTAAREEFVRRLKGFTNWMSHRTEQERK